MENLTYQDYFDFLVVTDSTPVEMKRYNEESRTFVVCELLEKPEIKGDQMHVYYTTKYGRFMKELAIDLEQNTCFCHNIYGVDKNGAVLITPNDNFTKQFIKWLKNNRFEAYKSFRTSLLNKELEKLRAQVREREDEKEKLISCANIEDLNETKTL